MVTQTTDETQPHLWIKALKEDARVRGLYLVKVKKAGTTKNGDPFLSITLGDRTGEVEARLWDKVDALSPLFNEGDIIQVEGHAGRKGAKKEWRIPRSCL